MKIVKQNWEFRTIPNAYDVYRSIENAGRTCYQSFDKLTPDSYKTFIPNAIKKQHMSIFEHESLSLIVTTDRAVLAEITRHRIGIAFSVESQRYCNYADGVEFILPVWFENIETPYTNTAEYDSKHHAAYETWKIACLKSEDAYLNLLNLGQSPQQARTVLNNSAAVKFVITANIREWRHILTLRTSKAAYPQIRELCSDILNHFKGNYGLLFDDIQSGRES